MNQAISVDFVSLFQDFVSDKGLKSIMERIRACLGTIASNS